MKYFVTAGTQQNHGSSSTNLSFVNIAYEKKARIDTHSNKLIKSKSIIFDDYNSMAFFNIFSWRGEREKMS